MNLCFARNVINDIPIWSDGCRYGFNGKEKEGEISEGDLDFGARIYDSKIGRWLSVDPLEKKFPSISTYAFCYNDPIRFKDNDGRYGSDGHYWTVFAMGVAMGLQKADAIALAMHAERYDNWVTNETDISKTHFENRFTYAIPKYQGSFHALNGLSSDANQMIAMTRMLNGDWDGLHLFGDALGHAKKSTNYKTCFGAGVGIYTLQHAFFAGREGREADDIAENASQYINYTNQMFSFFKTVAEIGSIPDAPNFTNLNPDMTLFERVAYSGLDEEGITNTYQGYIANNYGESFSMKYNKEIADIYDNTGVNYEIKKHKALGITYKKTIEINEQQ